MFQTEPIVFIQSFANAILTFFFRFISELGTMTVLSMLLLTVMFGVDYKRGFIFIQVAVFTAAVVSILKNFFALPRPYMVDSNVLPLGIADRFDSPFKSGGAGSYFEWLPENIVNYFHGLHGIDWGFPSGHTAGAVAIWGSVYNQYKIRSVRSVSIFFIIMLPLSRLYLGRHFIADILGGAVIGLVILTFYYYFIFREGNLDDLMEIRVVKNVFDVRKYLFWSYLPFAPLTLAFIPGVNYTVVGLWLGMNCAFIPIAGLGVPKDKGNLKKRIARVTIVLFLFILFKFAAKKAIIILGATETSVVTVFTNALVMFATFLLATESSVRLGLFIRKGRNGS